MIGKFKNEKQRVFKVYTSKSITLNVYSYSECMFFLILKLTTFCILYQALIELRYLNISNNGNLIILLYVCLQTSDDTRYLTDIYFKVPMECAVAS